MVKLSVVVILLLALVCFSMGDKQPSTTQVSNGDSTDTHGNPTTPAHTSSSSEPQPPSDSVEPSSSNSDEKEPENSSNEVAHSDESSHSVDESEMHGGDDNDSTDESHSDDESEHGGDDNDSSDESHSDDSNDEDGGKGHHHYENNYKPNTRYVHVRIIFVLSLEDILSLSNQTYDLREAIAGIFNISEKYVSIHFRLHGLKDESLELAESSFSSESESENESESNENSDTEVSSESTSDSHDEEASSSASNEHPIPTRSGSKPIRKERREFEMIVDIRVPVESVPNKIATTVGVNAGVNATLSNPDSDLSKALTASGAQNVRTATSPVTTVTPTNSTVAPISASTSEDPTSAPTKQPSVIDKIVGSGTMVAVSSVVMVMSVAMALVL